MATSAPAGKDAMAFEQVTRPVGIPIQMPRDRVANRGALDRERRFYVIASFAMLVITVIGFRQFLLHGRSIGGAPMTPQILG